MNTIETRDTFPDIRDAVTRNSSPLQSFSRVHLRNEEVVPLAKAFNPSDIHMEPRANRANPSAKI